MSRYTFQNNRIESDQQPRPGVYLVGAGPGDPGLMTLRGAEIIQKADSIIYDNLVSARILDCCTPGAERIFVGKQKSRHSMPQTEINQLLMERGAREICVRLKGGDPNIYGRVGEEVASLRAAGVRYEIIPGVTAASAAAASAGFPLTHRDHADQVIFFTGHKKNDGQVPWFTGDLEPDHFQTLVFYMSLTTCGQICNQLVGRGYPPTYPVALISRASLPGELILVSTLADLPGRVQKEKPPGPAILIAGPVVTQSPPAEKS